METLKVNRTGKVVGICHLFFLNLWLPETTLFFMALSLWVSY